MDNTNLSVNEEQSPQVVPPEPEKPSGHKKWLLTAGLILLVLIAAGSAAYVILSGNNGDKSSTTENSTTHVNKYLVSDNNYLCTSGGLRAVVCQNVVTGAQTKYEVPEKLGIIWSMQISPDGNNILLLTQTDSNNLSMNYYIVNRKMEVLHSVKLPGTGIDVSSVAWLPDGSSLIYDYGTAGKSDSQLYIYDIASGTSRLLTKDTLNITYPTVLKDGTLIAADDSKNPFVYYVVDTKTGHLTPLDTADMYKSMNDYQTLNYNASTDKFYVPYTTTSGKSMMRVGAVERTGDGYKMRILSEMGDPHLGFNVVITSKGAYVETPDTKKSINLFNGVNMTTVPFPNAASLMFTSSRLPFDNPAKDAKVTAADHLYETTTPPARLQQFLVDYVAKGCAAGEYRNVRLDGFDGDNQVIITDGDCGEPDTMQQAIFVYTNGEYTNVASSQEGFSCTLRDRYNLSVNVLPNCLQPGDNH